MRNLSGSSSSGGMGKETGFKEKRKRNGVGMGLSICGLMNGWRMKQLIERRT